MTSLSLQLQEGIDSLQLFESFIFIDTAAVSVRVTKLSGSPESPSYVSFLLNSKQSDTLFVETRVASQSLLEELYSTLLSETDFIETIQRVLPKPETVGVVVSRPDFTAPLDEPNSSTRNSKSLQTLAESILDAEDLRALLLEAFPSGKIKLESFVSKSMTYTFNDSGSKFERLLTKFIFAEVAGGEPILIQSMHMIYDNLNTPGSHGTVIITFFDSEKPYSTLLELLAKLQSSKLCVALGLDLSDTLSSDKANIIRNGSSVVEGDPIFSNGEKQEFTFDAEHSAQYVTLFGDAIREFSARHPNLSSVQFEF